MMYDTRTKTISVLRLLGVAVVMTIAGWLVADRVAVLRVERALAADAERIAAAVCQSEDPDLTIRAARLRGGERIAWIKMADGGASAFRIVRTAQGRVAVAVRPIGGRKFVEVAAYLDGRVARARNVVLI